MSKNIIIGATITAIALSIYLYMAHLNTQISALQTTIKDLHIELANSKLQSLRYKSSLNSQNKEIELLKSNEEISLLKLKKWKNQKPEIRYETIIEIKEVKSNECKDIRNVLTEVRGIKYDSL